VSDEIRFIGGGIPTPEEVAAVVGVLLSRGGAPTPDEPAVRAWNPPASLLRRPLPAPGPGVWALSLR
jgi:hypothetical protein